MAQPRHLVIYTLKNYLLKTVLYLTIFLTGPSSFGQSDSILLAPARLGGLWGYINQQGQWAIDPQYGYAKNFNENLAEIVMYQGDDIISGFINRNNKLVIRLPELNYSNISEGMLSYLEKNEYGFMDSTGTKTIPAQFKYCSNFSNGKAMVVFRTGKAGYINKSKQLLLSPRWDTAFSFHGKFAIVGKKDARGKYKYGIIDQYANHLIPIQYTFISPLGENKAFANHGGVYENGKISGGNWQILNMNKQSMLKLCDTTLNIDIKHYASFLKFKNGVSWCPGQYKGQVLYGLINENGDWVVLPTYKFVNNISEDMAGVNLGRKMGFIDIKGKNVIPCIYDMVGSFHNGIAWFKSGRKYGFLNKKGEVIIPPTFDEVGDFMVAN